LKNLQGKSDEDEKATGSKTEKTAEKSEKGKKEEVADKETTKKNEEASNKTASNEHKFRRARLSQRSHVDESLDTDLD